MTTHHPALDDSITLTINTRPSTANPNQQVTTATAHLNVKAEYHAAFGKQLVDTIETSPVWQRHWGNLLGGDQTSFKSSYRANEALLIPEDDLASHRESMSDAELAELRKVAIQAANEYFAFENEAGAGFDNDRTAMEYMQVLREQGFASCFDFERVRVLIRGIGGSGDPLMSRMGYLNGYLALTSQWDYEKGGEGEAHVTDVKREMGLRFPHGNKWVSLTRDQADMAGDLSWLPAEYAEIADLVRLEARSVFVVIDLLLAAGVDCSSAESVHAFMLKGGEYGFSDVLIA